MAFDGITIANIVHELKNELADGRISKIAQPENDELMLTIKSPSGQRRLYISASASLPLIYITEENKPSPMTAPNFCMLLRKHIGNGRIVDIRQPGLERIIHFDVEHLDELGDVCRKTLTVEIMGKHSNIIFCTKDGTIIDSIKHVSANVSSVREVLPGREYFIPDTMGKADPLTVTVTDFVSLMQNKPMSLYKALYTGFTGISPVAAEEVCHLAGLDSAVTANDLSEDLSLHLYTTFMHFMERVRDSNFSPTVYYNGDTPQEFSSLPLEHLDHLRKELFFSISVLLKTYYASRNTITRIRQKSVDLRKIVQTALERNRKKYDLQCRQMKDSENRDKFRVYGELINTYGYNLEPGARQLEALNYYTNKMVTIPLDEHKTPQENSQRYFDKYNKQKRTAEALTSLINETHDEITYLDSVSNALDIARSEADLAQIKEELIESGYVRRKPSKQKGKIVNKPLHYLSSDGFHMYVGKNNVQNDWLTFEFAAGNDWWFHSKGMPGSHVIVKTNGEELPDRVFEEAGKLAAHYSRGRGNEKVEVDYVEKKHIKKPKGANPGFVVYYTNYSLVINDDISTLKEIQE